MNAGCVPHIESDKDVSKSSDQGLSIDSRTPLVVSSEF